MLVLAKISQSGDNVLSMVAIGLSCACFHFGTLEEYYTGGLFLGPFNPISDGSVAVIGINIFMAIFGNEFWR